MKGLRRWLPRYFLCYVANEILADQSAGMNYLADVLRKELEEVDALLEKVEERKKRGQFGDRSRRAR
jgi:hypothetical protein